MLYLALSVCFISTCGMAYALAKLGEAYFSSASRNPTIVNTVSTYLLIVAAMIEVGMVVLIVFGFLLIGKI
jgi:F0F1-type ATP synthase membrane subunit c/vacuolar-type H+-ATPase subunit K